MDRALGLIGRAEDSRLADQEATPLGLRDGPSFAAMSSADLAKALLDSDRAWPALRRVLARLRSHRIFRPRISGAGPRR